MKRYSKVGYSAIVRSLLVLGMVLSVLSMTVTAETLRLKPPGEPPLRLKVQPIKVQGTFVEITSHGDVQVAPAKQINLSAPVGLRLHAWTSVEGAKGIGWRLERLPLQAQAVAQAGYLANTTNSTFSVDLRNFLPAKPPPGGATYILRTFATGKQKRREESGLRTKSSSDGTSAIPQLGYLSEPVVIRYQADSRPSVVFDETRRYRRMRVVMDKFRVVTGNNEISATDEYRIKGLTQELYTQHYYPPGWPQAGKAVTLIQQNGASRKFGILSKNMKPGDKPTESLFNIEIDPKSLQTKTTKDAIMEFDFGNTGNFASRRFIVAATIMERDGGGEIQQWSDAFDDVADYLDGPKIIGSPVKDFTPDIQKAYEDMRGEMLDVVKSALAEGTPSDPYSLTLGAAKAIATVFVGALVEGTKDDFYGTRSFTIDIGSNRVDAVEQSPGVRVSSKEGSGWRIGPYTWTFYGAPGALAASSFEGVVEIDFYVEFYDQVD